MSAQQIVRIDGIKWWIKESAKEGRLPVPLCPDHALRMTPSPKMIRNSMGGWKKGYDFNATELTCAEGPHEIAIPRKYEKEKQYVIDRMDAKIFAGMQVINLDDEAVPVAKEKIKSKDDKYFVVAQIMESKRGKQVVIYAGEKGSKHKTQIFIEPDIKRVAFDQKDLHPTDVFSELRAVFADGSSQEMKKGPA